MIKCICENVHVAINRPVTALMPNALTLFHILGKNICPEGDAIHNFKKRNWSSC